MKKILKSKSGFTLVEMLVVVTIIGILSTTIYSGYQRYINGAKYQVAEAQFTSIVECYEIAMVDNLKRNRGADEELNPENFQSYYELLTMDLKATFNYISDKKLSSDVVLEVDENNIVYKCNGVVLTYDTITRTFS